MRIDVSEVKSFRTCRRQWQLSSRNMFHLRPKVTPPAFILGTIFHEALHALYAGASLEVVMQMIKREIVTDKDAALLAMVPGYAKNVLPGDLDRFDVLEIEHKFSFVPEQDPDLEIVGSIDMIVMEKDTGLIYGFEHKTCKNFREPSYMWMDEQPRVYYVALQKYAQEKYPGHGVGGVYINEVKKLLRDLQYQRIRGVYPEDDLKNFMDGFFATCAACKNLVTSGDFPAPTPNYFTCKLCNFKGICEKYMYANLDLNLIVEQFGDEFIVRDSDHLEEKQERDLSN